jgi:hypothetical protein
MTNIDPIGQVPQPHPGLRGVNNRYVKKHISQLATERFGEGRVTFPSPEMRQIVAAQLSTDRRFNRGIKMHWVRKIALNFDSDKFKPIVVSERTDLTGINMAKTVAYVIIDGQHRIMALEQMGWMDQKVPCLVYTGLSFEQEAELFAISDDVLRLTRYDQHHSAFAAKRPEAVAIQEIVDRHGYCLEPGLKSGGAIQCVGALYDVYREGGPEALDEVLLLFKRTWQEKGWQPVSSSFKGMRQFLSEYRGDPDFREKRLIQMLKMTPPMDIDRPARSATAAIGGSIAINAARVIEQKYNNGLRSKRIRKWDDPK